MNQDYTKFLTAMLRDMAVTDHIRPSEIPDIDLYMDQVTHFMDEHLKRSKRYEDDKILTKTMINNYAKNRLLPPPEKKRYSKEHMLVLIFIYYYKGFLSLHDIQAILNPITDNFFASDSDFSIEDVYGEIYSLGKEHIKMTARDIMENYHTASNSFEDAPEENRDLLQLFSFICLLGFDIYLKKGIIEKMVDHLEEQTAQTKVKSKEKGKEKAREKGKEK